MQSFAPVIIEVFENDGEHRTYISARYVHFFQGRPIINRMTMDSSIFDLRLMNSGAISFATPAELGKSILPYLDQIIQLIPEEGGDLELRIRSIVNILVISKLQADQDRSELEMAKALFTERQDAVIASQPSRLGYFNILTLGHWTILSLSEDKNLYSDEICNNLSEIAEKVKIGKHLIFDFSRLESFDIKLAAYLMGYQGMLHDRGRKMSIAWLPRNAFSNTKISVQDSFTTKFNLYKKGSFLLSKDA